MKEVTLLPNKRTGGTWSVSNGERVSDMLQRILSEGFQEGKIEIVGYNATSSNKVSFCATYTVKVHKPWGGGIGAGCIETKRSRIVGEVVPSAGFQSTASYTPVLEFRSFVRVYYRIESNNEPT